MMDEKQFTADLNLLAAEMPEIDVDVEAVITTARQRTSRRKAVAGTALATAGLVAGVAVIVTATEHRSGTPGPVAAAGGSTSSSAPPPSGPRWPPVVFDAQARKFTHEFAQARVIPSGYAIGPMPDQRPGLAPFEFTYEPTVRKPDYFAQAALTNAHGTSNMIIWISKGPLIGGDNMRTCTLPPAIMDNCVLATLADGTLERTTHSTLDTAARANDNTVEVLRTDGTYVEVTSGPTGAETGIPLSLAELERIAGVLSY